MHPTSATLFDPSMSTVSCPLAYTVSSGGLQLLHIVLSSYRYDTHNNDEAVQLIMSQVCPRLERADLLLAYASQRGLP